MCLLILLFSFLFSGPFTTEPPRPSGYPDAAIGCPGSGFRRYDGSEEESEDPAHLLDASGMSRGTSLNHDNISLNLDPIRWCCPLKTWSNSTGRLADLLSGHGSRDGTPAWHGPSNVFFRHGFQEA